MAASAAFGAETLGHPVPPFAHHAIIFSLPAWRDNIDLRKPGERRVLDAMLTVYPRMFVHASIKKLVDILEQKLGLNGGMCLLYPSKKIAEEFQAFVRHQAGLAAIPGSVSLFQYSIPFHSQTRQWGELHIGFFSTELSPIAMEFWRYTGLGISSRFAEHCISILPCEDNQIEMSPGGSNQLPSGAVVPSETTEKDRKTNLEKGAVAKCALRRRISELLLTGKTQDSPQGQVVEAGPGNAEGAAARVAESDVFLFPTGMSAMWNAHQLCLRARPPAKSVCFGFPFVDTLSILEKWGPGVHFFGHGLDSDMDALEELLVEESSRDPTESPVLAVFTEFPSNPLLQAPDLPRLRALADAYNFLLVVDDTVGNSVNVNILPYADIVVTSLTKIFSGQANVMGGSLVLNPKGQYYEALKSHMSCYEDTYFDEDALVMEHNSRDLALRVQTINSNAEAILTFLRSRSSAEGAPSSVIKKVHYPKYTTPAHYLKCKRPEGGYGGLFTLIFTSLSSAMAFYDALPCYKGPSIGTAFTLACAYTALTLPFDLEWATRYGVEEAMVRISVGMENKDLLLRSVDTALKAAESVQ